MGGMPHGLGCVVEANWSILRIESPNRGTGLYGRLFLEVSSAQVRRPSGTLPSDGLLFHWHARIRRTKGLPKFTTPVLPPAFEDAHRIPDGQRP